METSRAPGVGRRRSVWRRLDAGPADAGGSGGIGGDATLISPPTNVAGTGGPPVAGPVRDDGGRRRRRRRTRRRCVAASDQGSLPAAAATPGSSAGASDAAGITRPRRIIDRSAKIAQAEEELSCALTVLVVGDVTAGSVDGLAGELAHRFDLPAGSPKVHRLCSNELLLVFTNEDEAVRVLNGGRPIILPQFTLHCRRWSRLRNATAVTLPQLVDVEISGIPEHAWELETAEHLLDEWCWVRDLSPDTLGRHDYSAFRLSAWCSCPELIPPVMDLMLVEPPSPVDDVPPLRRALSYVVKLKVLPVVDRSQGKSCMSIKTQHHSR